MKRLGNIFLFIGITSLIYSLLFVVTPVSIADALALLIMWVILPVFIIANFFSFVFSKVQRFKDKFPSISLLLIFLGIGRCLTTVPEFIESYFTTGEEVPYWLDFTSMVSYLLFALALVFVVIRIIITFIKNK